MSRIECTKLLNVRVQKQKEGLDKTSVSVGKWTASVWAMGEPVCRIKEGLCVL